MANGDEARELANLFQHYTRRCKFGLSGEVMFGSQCAGAGPGGISDIVKRPCASSLELCDESLSLHQLLGSFAGIASPRSIF